MTELELYKFTQDKELDWRGESLVLWIYFYDIEDFTNMIGYDYFSEDGEKVTLLHDCIAVDLNDICDNYDINPENILKKD